MAHLTAMKRRRAAVSWRFSQEVGKVGREERGRTGGRGEERRGGGGGRPSPPPPSETPERRLQRFLFLSTLERKEWKLLDWAENREGELVRGESGERWEWPGKLLWNIRGGEPPNISEEGLLGWGKPKFDWPCVRNPSLFTLGFLGPLSCWTASLFMLLSKHFFSLQARHWFRWVLSMGHFPFRSAEALQV